MKRDELIKPKNDIKILLRHLKEFLPINTPINTNIICIFKNDLLLAK